MSAIGKFKYALLYLNNSTSYDMIYITEYQGGYSIRMKTEIPTDEKIPCKELKETKNMSMNELKEYLQCMKYMIRKDKYPCQTIEFMSPIFPTVKMNVEEFSDTVINAILLSLQ